MQLNYFGPVKLILDLLPTMRERKRGHIINISTIGLQVNTPRFSAYVASKAALDAFSRSMAPEVIGDGVHVTTIYMPLVRTPMIAPTKIYDRFPTLSPDEAADMIAEAIRKRPKRMATAMGTLGQITYAIAPGAQDLVANQAYHLFPESDGGKAPRSRRQPTPSSGHSCRRHPRRSLVKPLEGIHHITAITADAQANVDFYAGVLGLRLVKKSVNQDDTSVYHLFYADETGDPGSDLTFFEYPGVPRGRRRSGDDPPHRLAADRARRARLLVRPAGRPRHRRGPPSGQRRVRRSRGAHPRAARVEAARTTPLIAEHPEIPPELALQGFHAVARLRGGSGAQPPPARGDARLLQAPDVGPEAAIESRELRGERRGGFYLL